MTIDLIVSILHITFIIFLYIPIIINSGYEFLEGKSLGLFNTSSAELVSSDCHEEIEMPIRDIYMEQWSPELDHLPSHNILSASSSLL